jgi:hypothetical protein
MMELAQLVSLRCRNCFQSPTMTRLPLTGLLVVCSLTSLAVAEDPKPMASAKAPGEVQKQGEAQKQVAEAQKKIMERADVNKDGVLSDVEKIRALEELKRHNALIASGLDPAGLPGGEELLKRFDKNRDGKLTGEEKVAAQAAMQKSRRGGGPVAGGLGGAAAGLPAGGAAPAGEKEAKPDRKPNPLIKLYDLDGDGKLNDEEKAALQADRGKKKAKDKAKKDE